MALPAIAATGFLSQVLAFIFASAIARVVVKVLSAFGVGFVAYTGFSSLVDMVQSYLDATIGGLPAQVFQVVDLCNIPAAINLLLAAYSARYTLFVMSKRLVFNPPGASA